MDGQCFALLIDADNVSAKYIKPILTELSKYGNITYKRIYGDWTNTQHSSWKDELLKNSITPIQQFSYTQGKNSTDSAMIIDAMDILYAKDVDGFCIVSSDSDFTRLVSRLRESGKMVIGMGENKTPEPFRKACDKFTILENLLSEKGLEDGGGESHEVLGREKVEDAVIKMIMENQDNNKQTGLGEVGSRLVSLYPDFDVRSYGYSSLSKFFEEFDRIQLVKHGHVAWVTLKENRARKEDVDQFVRNLVKGAGEAGMDLGAIGNRVYDKYKDYKFNPIKPVDDFDVSVFTSAELAILESVAKYAACYSGKILEEITHLEAPWLNARKDKKALEPSDEIIKKEDIKEYFIAVKEKNHMTTPADIKEYFDSMVIKI